MRGRAGSAYAAQGGFTMIEVMIALLLTAIAMIGIIALYMTETRASGFTRHTAEATALAEDKVERLRTIASGTLTPGVTAGDPESNINERGVAGGIYTRSWTETPTANYDVIAVTVSWSDDNVAHSVTVNARRMP